MSLINIRGKIYINFTTLINNKKEETKLIQVSSIDKVTNDKLCFVYNKYLYLIKHYKLLTQDSIDKIEYTLQEMNQS